jgi:cysteine-rich repeat protein
VVSLYIGLTPAGTYTDVDKKYVPLNGNLYFFMDNTTGAAAVSESSPGTVTFLRVSDKPTTALGLAASINDACQAVACGNGKLEVGEGCDDGNNVAGDGCNKTCKIENGFACGTSDAGINGADSCASGACDARDKKCGFANGAGSTCDTNNAKVVCRSGSCGPSSGKCVPMGGCFTDGDCTSNHCDTPTFTCLPSTPDAGPADAAAPDASLPAYPDAGFPAAAEPSSDSCQCMIGPQRSSMSALALFVGGLVVALRRRKRRPS